MNTLDIFDHVTDIENEEDSDLATPRLLEGVVVTDTDWTTETVLNQVDKGNIILNPSFQRREAWDDRRKSRFIESLILGLPIPQLVLAEIKGARGRYLVIDGKQRLLALMKFAASNTLEKLKLKGLDIRSDLNGLTWEQLKSRPELSGDVAAFENAQVRTTVIRGWQHEEALYLIFHRLNSGSVPLSPQELRHVLHPGPFINFAFEFAEGSDVFITLLGNKGQPDFRMRDVELLIRFFGMKHFLLKYEGDLKKFLDKTVNQLNESWLVQEDVIRNTATNCSQAITFTIELFGDEAFSKWTAKGSERRFNRAVFDVMTYYFSNEEVRQKIKAEKLNKAVVDSFHRLCETNPKFVKALESTTKSREAFATRLLLWGETLQKTINLVTDEFSDVTSLASSYEIK